MRVLVPIKRVPDPYAKVRPLADGSGLDTGSVKFEINPFDEIALEEAVRQREKGSVTEIVAVTVGGPETEDQLRKALAMGADKAIRIEATGLDSPAVADELAALARELNPDLILMGKQATDVDDNQVGQMLAAVLDWPQATFASKVSLAGRVATVTRETDTGEETLELDLPAVVTVDLRLNEPRYIALPAIIKAKAKPLERRPRSTDAAPRTKLVRIDAPPPRAAGRKVANVDELVAAIQASGVLG
ncbi:electron transfer flavoprotein beta subunit/FixA family protein [bacterium]|nr:MAG: electron transfer flavoprotein beta subunit/FixA family protein [bacterium]